MTEQAKKTPAKKTAPKAAANPKAGAKAKLEKGAAGTVTVTQVVGSIARQDVQRRTLIGLGLNKRHRTRTLKDSPEVRGMIYAVRHLVKVEA